VTHQFPDGDEQPVCQNHDCAVIVDAALTDAQPLVPCPSLTCHGPGNQGYPCVFVRNGAGGECSYCGLEWSDIDRDRDDTDIAVYSAGRLPDGEWTAWERTTATRMTPLAGPCVVTTVDGSDVVLDETWRGWLAVDSEGHPYPIASSVHATSYRPVTHPPAAS
jgi:hypothetical protein